MYWRSLTSCVGLNDKIIFFLDLLLHFYSKFVCVLFGWFFGAFLFLLLVLFVFF